MSDSSVPRINEPSFKKGSIIKKVTDHLLEDEGAMIAMMGHRTHPFIYGLVDSKRNGVGDSYNVQWAIMGLLNLDSDKVYEINLPRQPVIYLSLVRDKDDKNEGDDEYVKQ